jgi:hypothetical protein
VLEGLDVAAQEARELLVEEEAHEERARPGEHHHEGREAPLGAPDRHAPERAPVDLGLLARQRAQAQEGLGGGPRAHERHQVAEVIGSARIAALADHGVEPAGVQIRVLLEHLVHEGPVGVEQRGAGRGVGLRGHAQTCQYAAHGRVMERQLAGDGPDPPALGQVQAHDLRFELLRDHENASSYRRSGPPDRQRRRTSDAKAWPQPSQRSGPVRTGLRARSGKLEAAGASVDR